MSAQTWFNANLVCLQKAVLCANCEVISEGLNGHCAACGSEALLSLHRLLGGAIEGDLTFAFQEHAPGTSDFAHDRYLSVAA
jgi:hypothetical protein